MIEKKTHKVVVKRESTVVITCDLCNARDTHASGFESRADWGTEAYVTASSCVFYSTGTNYGTDGGDKTTREAHLCVKCMRETVVHALELIGVKFHETKTNW